VTHPYFSLDFVIKPLTHRNIRPNRVRHPTDCTFTSSCPPPRFTATQLLSVTGIEHIPREDFHLSAHACFQAHGRGHHWPSGPSNRTTLKFEEAGDFQTDNPAGRNLHFGIRDHAMAAIMNRLSLSKLRAFGASFFIFSDYARPAMRLSALMELPTIFIFTHDAMGDGENGPTHQPVEQLASLRAVPGLITLRPGDANEVVDAYLAHLQGLRHRAYSPSTETDGLIGCPQPPSPFIRKRFDAFIMDRNVLLRFLTNLPIQPRIVPPSSPLLFAHQVGYLSTWFPSIDYSSRA
jgi:hypothetical protein